MSMFKRKTITVRDEQEETLNAVELWSVHWNSRHGCFSSDVRPTAEFFTNEDDAHAFKDALRDAAKLLRYKEHINIKMRREE